MKSQRVWRSELRQMDGGRPWKQTFCVAGQTFCSPCSSTSATPGFPRPGDIMSRARVHSSRTCSALQRRPMYEAETPAGRLLTTIFKNSNHRPNKPVTVTPVLVHPTSPPTSLCVPHTDVGGFTSAVSHTEDKGCLVCRNNDPKRRDEPGASFSLTS